MIRQLYLYQSESHDPYRNLAIEKLLLSQAQDRAILYLWQNENTVVIGRNQNPWKECKTALLHKEGGHLARRLSGGGAVYHDLGNLNFTILLPQEDYDLDRQLAVIQRAVESLGIPAERSGRNDLLVDGRKFSGNAFYKNGKQAYHHGTLLICADTEKMSRYLSPSVQKLQAKGVDSVRSRVENLCHWKPELTVSAVGNSLKQAFSQVYGLPLESMPPLNETEIAALAKEHASRDWNFGQKLPFTCSLEGRFPWGGAEIAMTVEHGVIMNAAVYTDAMETNWVSPLESALVGCPLDQEALAGQLAHLEHGNDLLTLFA